MLLIIVLGVYLLSSIYLIVAMILSIEDPEFPGDVPLLEICFGELISPLFIVSELYPKFGRAILNRLGVYDNSEGEG